MKSTCIKLVKTGVVVLLFSVDISAQQPLNLDFERKSIEGINRPWGWDHKSWGPAVFRMDSLVVKSGKFSLNSVNQKDHAPAVTQSMSFVIESFEFRKRKIQLSGSIRAEQLNGAASLSLGYTFFDSAKNSFAEFDTTSLLISGTSGWVTRSIELAIPSKALSVYVTANHSGTGKAWFDDLKLTAGGKVFNQVAVARPFTKDNISWLTGHSSLINSSAPVGNNYVPKVKDELEHFKKEVGNSRIVALGESTHGTSEFFSLKHRVFQYAVTKLGFRVFAIEDNQLAVEQVNKYVLTGNGTAKESMSGMFAVWYNEEVLSLIEWVRMYNEDHKTDKLSFVGFDMQEIGRPADSLSAFLKTRDTTLYNNTAVVLKDLKENGPKSYALGDSIKLSWLSSTKEMLEQVKSKGKQWLTMSKNRTDSLAIMLGIQYATLIKQYAENTYEGHWSLYRDEAMAENISWLLETRFPGSRIFIWAHDSHISRCDHPNELLNLHGSISMGSFLSKKYGNLYKSFSLSTYEGEYLALKSYSDFTKVKCPLFKGPVGSLDEALHRVAKAKKSNILFLQLPRTFNWLAQPLPKRFANHVSIDYGYWERISIPYQFDGMFFIDKTTAADYLTK